jgi:hypothetical protein
VLAGEDVKHGLSNIRCGGGELVKADNPNTSPVAPGDVP